MAIRKNDSLNCACCNPADCPNGPDYADRINPLSGRKNCTYKHRLGHSDITHAATETAMNSDTWMQKIKDLVRNKTRALDAQIDMDIEIRNSEKRFQTKEECLFEEEKGERNQQVSKKSGTVNDPKRIEQLLELSKILKIVELSHQNPPVSTRKDLSFLVNEEYQYAAVRQEERRALLREKLGIVHHNNPVVDFVLPNPHRFTKPRIPLWVKK